MFLQNDLKCMDIPFLKKLCKNEGLRYSNLKKNEIFELLNKNLAIKIIQRCFRNYFYKNAVDHISLEQITFPCFIYRTKSGKHYFYSYESIIKYIMKTGDCRDPMTRENYSDNDLLRLDKEVKLHFPNIKYRNTYKIKKNLNYARRIRNRENEILSVQMRMDEIKELIIYINISQMFLWKLDNEPILIENIEYRSIESFIQSVINELKMVLENLRQYDQNLSETYKLDLLQTLKEFTNNQQFIQLISEI